MALFRPPPYALGNSVGLGYFKLAFLVTLGRGCQALHCTGGAWPGSRTGEQQRESWNSESKPVGGPVRPPTLLGACQPSQQLRTVLSSL